MTLAPLSEAVRFLRHDGAAVEWTCSPAPVGYLAAVAAMEARVAAIAAGEARELVWLLEHPSLYTAGVSARPADLLDPERFPVFASGRGGQFTYHGPGQRVAYLMLDLRARKRDARAFVNALEALIIDALARVGVQGEIREGRVGVWVRQNEGSGEDKIAAIGVKLRRWISFHGVSVNVDPELEHFSGIVPCGISEHGVTSLAKLGRSADTARVDAALADAFVDIFGPIVEGVDPPA